MIPGGHGSENPNENYLTSRGFYLFYLLFIVGFHLILLSLPFISTALAWTLTNLCHNLAHLYFLHIIKGTPWISPVDRDQSRETHWEQLDSGKYWTDQKKFLTAAPIVLFLLTCLYTQNSEVHFVINFVSLVVVVLPKFPIFHHRRLFNINKY